MPVIASLNGSTPGGWTSIAELFQEAGADAIELNIYFLATDLGRHRADVEQRYVDLVESVDAAGHHPGGREAPPVLQRDGQHGGAH